MSVKNELKFAGKITFISKLEQVGADKIDKRYIVVEEPGVEYPSSIAVDFWKERCEGLSNLNVGDLVSVAYNMKAREYEGKHFLNASGRNVRTIKEGEANDMSTVKESDKDELPF